jgi:hypothetical protein
MSDRRGVRLVVLKYIFFALFFFPFNWPEKWPMKNLAFLYFPLTEMQKANKFVKTGKKLKIICPHETPVCPS